MSECDLLKLPLVPMVPVNNDLIKIFDILKKPDRVLLANRYHEFEFIDNLPQSDKCVQCSQISFSHFISQCGHVFCEICKDVQTMCEEEIWTCPKCLSFQPEITLRNAGLELKILSLSAMCPNKSKGCKFSSTLMEMPKHIRECDRKFDVKNPIDPASTALTQLKTDLDEVMMNLERKYVRLEDTITLLLASETRKLCLAIEAHREYINVKGKAIDDAFDYVNNCLSQLNETEILTKLKDAQIRKRQLIHMQEKFNSELKPKRCFIPLTSTVHTWVIMDVSQLKKENLTITFPLNGQPILAQVELRYIAGSLDLQLTTTSDNDNLATPYPRVTFTLRYLKISESINQEEGTSETENKRLETTEEYLFSKVEDIEFKQPYVYNCSFESEVFQTIEGSLTIFISVDFPHLIEKSSFLNGTVRWGIRDFMKIINNAKISSDIYYSPYFYSGMSSFRMKVELNAANYLSNVLPFKVPFCRIPLLVRILTGENDAAIADQFKIDFSLGVLNHENDLIPIDRATTTETHCNLKLLTLNQMQPYLNNGTLWVVIAVNSINY